MYFNTEGITLHSVRTGEADIITHVITEQYGIMHLILKGIKKSSRRSAVVAETGALSHYTFARIAHDKPTIVKEAQIIDLHASLRDSIRGIVYMDFLIELVKKTTPLQIIDPYLFRMLKAALSQLEHHISDEHLILFFTIHLLRINGLLPNFDSCGSCKKNDTSDFHLSISEKAILCPVCARIPRGEFFRISRNQREFTQNALTHKFSACSTDIVPADEALTLLYYLLLYTEHYFQIKISSKNFLFTDNQLLLEKEISAPDAVHSSKEQSFS
jgi:DNA repair protein RecO